VPNVSALFTDGVMILFDCQLDVEWSQFNDARAPAIVIPDPFASWDVVAPCANVIL
jgi:hypothetical protein